SDALRCDCKRRRTHAASKIDVFPSPFGPTKKLKPGPNSTRSASKQRKFRSCNSVSMRWSYRKTPASKIEELEPAGHARGNFRFVKIRAADGSDISGGQSHCRGNEIVIAKNAVGRIQADPAGTGQKNFRPGVKRPFGAPPLGIAFSQISA